MAISGKTTTTIKLATLSAAAKDDIFSVTENNAGNNSVKLNVLSNDPGAAVLYSVWQPTGPIGATPATSNQLPIVSNATLPSGATITMNADGTITYDAGAGFQHLGAGAKATDTFSYTVRMGNGALSTATVTVQVMGQNDLASINVINGGDAGTVIEDGIMSTSGVLSVSDVDDGENGFQAVPADALTGAYGNFTFDNGAWTFSGNNAAAQHLGKGDTATQSLTVTSLDGTATETITVTIRGVNDAASISGQASGSVTEDDVLIAGGSLSVSDVDDDENLFQPVLPEALTGAYGNFTFDNGAWTFSGNNAAAQHLGKGDTATQSLTVTSLDGTATETITVTIQGINDAASISGQASGSVTEDDVLITGGSLSVSDIDDDEAGFQEVEPTDLAGIYGDFTFDASNGEWNYTLRNDDVNVQALNDEETVYDTLTVKSLDGTEQEIKVTINGADEPADIGTGSTNSGDGISNSPKTYIVNYGQDAINQRNVIEGFDSNDVLKYAKNLKWKGDSTINYDESMDGSEESTAVYFDFTAGKGPNAVTHHIEVILVGYTGFSEAQLI